jgi:hypothetical protein
MKEEHIRALVSSIRKSNQIVQDNLNIGFEQHERYRKNQPLTPVQRILAKCIHCRVIQYKQTDLLDECPITDCPLQALLNRDVSENKVKK